MTTTNEDAGLLACPFCGGKPEMYYPFHLMGNPGQAAKYHGGVRCTKCHCESRATTPTDDSIFFWNRRAPSKVQVEAVRATWQPIETAPKTGCTLLLGYPNALGKWRTVRGQWMSEAYIAESWEEPDDVEPGWYETSAEADDTPNCWYIEPTHWMPLPEAPDAAAASGGEKV